MILRTTSNSSASGDPRAGGLDAHLHSHTYDVRDHSPASQNQCVRRENWGCAGARFPHPERPQCSRPLWKSTRRADNTDQSRRAMAASLPVAFARLGTGRDACTWADCSDGGARGASRDARSHLPGHDRKLNVIPTPHAQSKIMQLRWACKYRSLGICLGPMCSEAYDFCSILNFEGGLGIIRAHSRQLSEHFFTGDLGSPRSVRAHPKSTSSFTGDLGSPRSVRAQGGRLWSR